LQDKLGAGNNGLLAVTLASEIGWMILEMIDRLIMSLTYENAQVKFSEIGIGIEKHLG
jgi:hypothetical protein